MKIIFEGLDRTGKDTQIQKFREYFSNNNEIFHELHYGKYINKDIETFSKKAYTDAFEILNSNKNLLCNRFHGGEYVYGQLYRNYDPNYIFELEKSCNMKDTFLIVLIDDANNLLSRDDKKGYTSDINLINKEIKLFTEFYNKSNIVNKLLINIKDYNIDQVYNFILQFINKNEYKFYSTISTFSNLINKNEVVIDNNDSKTVELIGHTIDNLNPLQPILNFFNIRKTPKEYCKKEIDWYNSKSLSIKNYVDDIKIWNHVATKDDKQEINSNYGWCIYSSDNNNQYTNVINELKNNMYSRRAIMIYNRPEMWTDYNRNGMSDFMCTMSTQIFIRDNKLYYVIHQRSLDFYISGIGSDFYWHCDVYNKLYSDLLKIYPNLKIGNIKWLINSCHLYERHFKKINKIDKIIKGGY